MSPIIERHFLIYIIKIMDKLALYKINTKYIEYLKQYDQNVCEPKDFGRARQYIGILVYKTNDFYWFAPLTSKTKKPNFYCVKLFDSEAKPIASIRINNLVPICKIVMIYIKFLITPNLSIAKKQKIEDMVHFLN